MAKENQAISVIEPINPAVRRVKEILFQPFGLGKWFVIAFCAWLAGLANGGGGANFFQKFNRSNQSFHNAKDAIIAHLSVIIPVFLAVLILITALWLVLTWLSSRGKFMFLHCVANNEAQVKVPWHKFQKHGNSLFLFRIVLGIISFAAIVIPVIITVLLVLLSSKAEGGPSLTAIIGLCSIVFLIILIIIAMLLVGKFTTDFVVPVMSLRTASCVDGWKQFLPLLSANKGPLTLYILFQIVISIVICMIILAAVLATCCCACCFLVIPYLGTVLMLPILIFKRAYSLYYLAQFGAEFDCFAVEAETSAQEEITE